MVFWNQIKIHALFLQFSKQCSLGLKLCLILPLPVFLDKTISFTSLLFGFWFWVGFFDHCKNRQFGFGLLFIEQVATVIRRADILACPPLTWGMSLNTAFKWICQKVPRRGNRRQVWGKKNTTAHSYCRMSEEQTRVMHHPRNKDSSAWASNTAHW